MSVVNLTPEVTTIRALAPVVAGQTKQTTEWVDTANYDGVRFIAVMGTITSGAEVSMVAKQSDESNGGSAEEISGSKLVVSDDDGSTGFIVEVKRPTSRYVALEITRATQNAVIELVIAELYGPRKYPAPQDADITDQVVVAG